MGHSSYHKLPRELTHEEEQILQRLLTAVEFPGRPTLLEQAARARVSGECTCGCRSIELRVPDSVRKAEVKRRIPVEAEAEDQDHRTMHCLLHVVDGWIAELEIYRDDSKAIGRLPAPERLCVMSLDEDV
ncbi:DUF6984 family protein [Limnochorda pilosa]|uniref:DUF6984 domain-containing protein n=1 Tax=Limnochorda pilosa TaxID=1555112 RepID=A0A0K2SGZ2_LIMPI|nr:hypothetical protein LIP_0503 [Limnochorda pilosa]